MGQKVKKIKNPLGNIEDRKKAAILEKVAKNKELLELSKSRKKQVIQEKNVLIDNWVNAKYFLARYNMLADQLNGKIIETCDGATKTKEFLMSEMMLMKVRAIKSHRNAFFNAKELRNYGLTTEDIEIVKKEYFEKPIVREEYDEGYESPAAKFVDQEAEK